MPTVGPAKRSVSAFAATAVAFSCVAATGGGCSFVFVDGPPTTYERLPYLTCSDSVGWPVVDTIVGTLSAISLLVALRRADSDYAYPGITREGDIAEDLALLALFGASAAVGYSRVSDCRSAKQRWTMRQLPGQGNYTPGYGYPAGGYPPSYPPAYVPPPASAPLPVAPPTAPGPAPPAAPAPSPPPPAAPPGGTAPAQTRLVPRLKLHYGAFWGRLGALPSTVLLAKGHVRLVSWD